MTKAPIKASIEIHDVKDKDACTRALGQMYKIIAEHYGEGAWFRIAQDAARGLPQPPEWLAEKKMVNACRGIDPEKLRLVLEYYSMPRPNKQRLAIELAKKNETLPPIKRYGPKGTTDPMTMLTQIKRVFLKYNEACCVIGDSAPALRQKALRSAETMSQMRAEARAMGIPRRRWTRNGPPAVARRS
jgi:hypothetical protein